jgi:hypothetical protein
MKFKTRLLVGVGLLAWIECVRAQVTNTVPVIPLPMPESWYGTLASTIVAHSTAIVSSGWLMREIPTFFTWFKQVQDAGGAWPNLLRFWLGRTTFKVNPPITTVSTGGKALVIPNPPVVLTQSPKV